VRRRRYKENLKAPPGELAGRRFLFVAVSGEMGTKTVEEFFFFASVDILLELFERKVNDVVMMELFGLDEIAKAQP